MAIPGPEDRHVIFRQYVDAVGLQGMAAAEAAGLHPSEWYAVSRIALAGRLTSGELAAHTGLTTGATTRLIDRLEKAGYARRVTDPADRRKVIVEPVTDVFTAVEDVVGPARRRIAEVLDRYTPEQLDLLFDYFTHAAPAFRQATEEIREHSGTGGTPARRSRKRTAEDPTAPA